MNKGITLKMKPLVKSLKDAIDWLSRKWAIGIKFNQVSKFMDIEWEAWRLKSKDLKELKNFYESSERENDEVIWWKEAEETSLEYHLPGKVINEIK